MRYIGTDVEVSLSIFMGLLEPGTNKFCSGEGQEQFARKRNPKQIEIYIVKMWMLKIVFSGIRRDVVPRENNLYTHRHESLRSHMWTGFIWLWIGTSGESLLSTLIYLRVP
jgi:hypothetical protein